MTASVSQIITLEKFLKLPYIEDSPAWEYSGGIAIQKFFLVGWVKSTNDISAPT